MLRTILAVCALFFATVAYGQPKTSAQRVEVNGMQMYYETSGQGEPLVVLHGAYMNVPSMGLSAINAYETELV